jgi:hypothetical protein
MPAKVSIPDSVSTLLSRFRVLFHRAWIRGVHRTGRRTCGPHRLRDAHRSRPRPECGTTAEHTGSSPTGRWDPRQIGLILSRLVVDLLLPPAALLPVVVNLPFRTRPSHCRYCSRSAPRPADPNQTSPETSSTASQMRSPPGQFTWWPTPPTGPASSPDSATPSRSPPEPRGPAPHPAAPTTGRRDRRTRPGATHRTVAGHETANRELAAECGARTVEADLASGASTNSMTTSPPPETACDE